MGAELITQRQIIGSYYSSLQQDGGMAWIEGVSNYYTSDQDSEQYAWISQSPVMREWIGGRQAKGFTENNIAITNKHFEATLEILTRDLRRDKSRQILTRVEDLARRTNSHWASLLSTLIKDAESTVCYDGQYFFDTDHSEGDSGSQSNSIQVDISAMPVAIHGDTTNPAVAEMQYAIAQAIQQIMGFVDDKGEPMNETAFKFLVMVPTTMMNLALQAVATPVQVSETQTALQALKRKFSIDAMPNARLSTWTDKFAVFRTDGKIKSFIRQEETKPKLNFAKWTGSEFEFDEDAVQVGVDTWRNVGYGMWQNSCLVTLV